MRIIITYKFVEVRRSSIKLANVPVPTEDAPPDPSSDELNFQRKNFPESWIWSDVIVGSALI